MGPWSPVRSASLFASACSPSFGSPPQHLLSRSPSLSLQRVGSLSWALTALSALPLEQPSQVRRKQLVGFSCSMSIPASARAPESGCPSVLVTVRSLIPAECNERGRLAATGRRGGSSPSGGGSGSSPGCRGSGEKQHLSNWVKENVRDGAAASEGRVPGNPFGPGRVSCRESPAPAAYLVDLPADLPDSPHQELLQVATLGAWPPILPNQAPGRDRPHSGLRWGVGGGAAGAGSRGAMKRKGDWAKGKKHDGNWEIRTSQ